MPRISDDIADIVLRHFSGKGISPVERKAVLRALSKPGPGRKPPDDATLFKREFSRVVAYLPSYAEGKGDTLSLSDAVNTSLSGGQEAAIKRALTWFEDNFGMTKDDAARVIKNSKQLVADLNAGGIGSLAPQTIVTIGSTSALLNEASKHLSDDQYATLLLHHRAQFEDALLGTIDETVAGILELVGAASTPIPVAGVEVAVTPEVKTELAFLVNAVAARVAARRVQELVDLLD